ncbi:MAG TPA: hypothetical protein PLJ21_13355 [Pseudobdellovibrionaceae bacterium]|nr:hypothetical protein [Pseudobdellovibrionaceae bacterium]
MNFKNPSPKISDTVPEGFYQTDQPVQLVIKSQTDLGYKAIVDQKFWGVLYYNEVFQNIEKNQEITGYIRKIREDGKIDLALLPSGHQAAQDLGEKIIEVIIKAGGTMNVTDKTDAETIYRLFGVSKKKFKIALGGLYKQRKITISQEFIQLNPISGDKKK